MMEHHVLFTYLCVQDNSIRLHTVKIKKQTFFLTTVTNHSYSPLRSSKVTVLEMQKEEEEREEESQSYWSKGILSR